jgi:hypothetical protein
LCFRLTAGQTHESQALDMLLEAADEQLLDEEGERIPWPLLPLVGRKKELSVAPSPATPTKLDCEWMFDVQ